MRVVPFGGPSDAGRSGGETRSGDAGSASAEAELASDLDAALQPEAEPDAETRPDAGRAPASPPSVGAAVSPAGAVGAACGTADDARLVNPTGAFQVSVRASGSGCPPCTTHTTLAADGQTFTTTFETFEVAASDADDGAPKQCTLAIALRSTSAYAYAVSSVSYRGTAELATGEAATQETRHQLQGQAQATSARAALTGPRAGAYEHDAPIASSDLVWSGCGPSRDLTVDTTLSLTQTDDSKAWISLHEAGGQLRFKLEARRCTP